MSIVMKAAWLLILCVSAGWAVATPATTTLGFSATAPGTALPAGWKAYVSGPV